MRYLAELSIDELQALRTASPEAKAVARYDWYGERTGISLARRDQHPPAGSWRHWLNLGGRGGGKTRSGAELVRRWARDYSPIHLVGPTAADVRDVMINGDSGILAISPTADRPEYQSSRRRLLWPNGAYALLFSAEDPESLRGPQCTKAWADEPCAWQYPESTWDMLMFGLRLGDNPQAVITTTPKALRWLRTLMESPECVVSRYSTYANADNLAAAFFTDIIRRYEGTRLGRQELNAEIMEDADGALWQRAVLDEHRVSECPPLSRLVVGVDPSGTSGSDEGDEIGIIAAGLGKDRHGYVIEDGSCRLSPQRWAARVVELYHRHRADRIIVEKNFGGAMVQALLRTVDAMVPVREVTASRGKEQRAEPVAALYEQGRVHHVGALAKLEDEYCGWVPGESDFSPNRLDAAVWALTDLMLARRAPNV